MIKRAPYKQLISRARRRVVLRLTCFEGHDFTAVFRNGKVPRVVNCPRSGCKCDVKTSGAQPNKFKLVACPGCGRTEWLNAQDRSCRWCAWPKGSDYVGA